MRLLILQLYVVQPSSLPGDCLSVVDVNFVKYVSLKRVCKVPECGTWDGANGTSQPHYMHDVPFFFLFFLRSHSSFQVLIFGFQPFVALLLGNKYLALV